MLGAEKASPDREEVFIIKPTALLSGVSWVFLQSSFLVSLEVYGLEFMMKFGWER